MTKFPANHSQPTAPPVGCSSNVLAWGRTSCTLAFAMTRRLVVRLKSFALLFNSALREIFDESAYARFLNQRQLAPSRAAYAAFRQEYEVTKARRPRCC